MGGEEHAVTYEKRLVQEIDELYTNFKMSNQNKNTVEVREIVKNHNTTNLLM